ncbi:MAG: CoA transferase [Frankiales bacterium]|nr:CoA transferase [Frankiales bacterium]
MPDLPLVGTVVVEVATGTASALASRMMAGYGAEVLKVEPPSGDPMRGVGPFPAGHADGETSAAFLYFHGGKSSVVLDLDTAAARAELANLLAGADILLTDVPLSKRESLGLSEAHLREAVPRLTVISVTPYGETGPQANYLATDLTEAASGGQMSLMGDPGKPPLKAYGNQAECQSAFHVYGAAMAALLLRFRTDKGSYVELAVQELQASAMEAQGPMAYNRDPAMPGLSSRTGNGMRVTWSQYRCKDGYAGIFVNAPNLPSFFEAIGRPDDLSRALDDEFMTGELLAYVKEWCAVRTRNEVYEVAIAIGAPFSYVATPDDLLTSPTIEQTGIWREVQHPIAGTFRVPGPPFRASNSAFELRPAPLLGEHTAEVLSHRSGHDAATVTAIVGQSAATRVNAAV